MNKICFKICLLICVALAAFSCKTAKQFGDTEYASSAKFNPQTVAAAHSDWTDITINGKVNVGKSSTAVIKMVKGKSLSISLRPLLGIEIGKLYFEGDTVTVVDKYHKAYLQEPIGSFIGDYVNMETLQALFLAHPFIIGGEVLSNDNSKQFGGTDVGDDDVWLLSPKKQRGDYQYVYTMKGNNVSKISIKLSATSEYSMDYSDFMTTPCGDLPSTVQARIPMGGKVFPFELNYKSAKWNTGFTDGISIPGNATRYSFEEILTLLTKM